MNDVFMLSVGFVLGFVTTYYFYVRSTKDLAQKTEELFQLNVRILRCMEEAGLVELVWYKDGKRRRVPGMIVKISGLIKMYTKVTGRVTVDHKKSGN